MRDGRLPGLPSVTTDTTEPSQVASALLARVPSRRCRDRSGRCISSQRRFSLAAVPPASNPPTPRRRQPSLAEPDGRRRLGHLGEELAAAHLKRLGFTLLERNVRTRYGEIDLIVFDGRTLVFAEVVADYRPGFRASPVRLRKPLWRRRDAPGLTASPLNISGGEA
jgi:Uncharacterised protein family UPF0102